MTNAQGVSRRGCQGIELTGILLSLPLCGHLNTVIVTYLVLKLSVFLIVLPIICLSHFVIWVSTGLQAPIYLEALGFAEEKVRLGTSSLYKAKKKKEKQLHWSCVYKSKL